MNLGIGVDVGGTHITSCGVDLSTGELIESTYFQASVNSKGSKEEIFTDWAVPINQTISAIGENPIAGVGFGMPGAFNYREGIGLFEGNDKYYALNGVDVSEEFLPYLDRAFSTLRFINDATAFGVGTTWQGQAKDVTKCICMTLGTGFGSAFLRNGFPVVKGKGVPRHGCLWHLPYNGSIADDYFSTRWFISMFEQMTGFKARGVKEIVESPYQEEVKMLFDVFGCHLAELLSPWLTSFQPELVVIGGNISKAWMRMQKSFHGHLAEQGKNVRVEISELMESAAIRGGARLLVNSYWEQVKNELPVK